MEGGIAVAAVQGAKVRYFSPMIETAIGFNMSGQNREVVEAFVDSIKGSPLYGWNRRFDQMIQYDDMASQVKEIEKFMKDKDGFIEVLQNAGISRDEADKIYETLKMRADTSSGQSILEKVLSSDHMFGGGPIRFSFLLYKKPLYAFIHADPYPESANRYYSIQEAA